MKKQPDIIEAKRDYRTLAFSLLTFFFPFILCVLTRSSSLMFDDAAEFALVIKLGSIAHPPGTPAFIFFGMLWDRLWSLVSNDTVFVLTVFSAFSVAASSLLLYLMFRMIISKSFPKMPGARNHFVSSMLALMFATGATTWTWGNTIEVYAFQVFATSLMLFGLVKFNVTGAQSTWSIVVASFGYGLGLANHHLEALILAPVVPLFFMGGLFDNKTTDRMSRNTRDRRSFGSEYLRVFSLRSFQMMVGLTIVFTALLYVWMVWRAQADYAFMFGQPKTLDLLWYHMTGGTYAKNLQETTGAIRYARLQYFLRLTFFQYALAFPVVLLGLYDFIKKRRYKLLLMVLFVYASMLLYQVNNISVSNADAYMLIPFMMLLLPAVYGVIRWFDKIKFGIVLPLMLCGNLVYNYPLHDRTNYNVSESLLHLLDVSAPKNSIVLIGDWTLVIQYYYARIVEGFRPDLVVLNYDVKFTHYRILPILYPEFYQKIKKEYDNFIANLEAEHPREIVSTGCDLTSSSLSTSFEQLIVAMERIALKEGRPFLTDPKADSFYAQLKISDADRYVSGCFVSSVPTTNNDLFLSMQEKWMDSPLLLRDLTALDKMVDFQVMLDNDFSYFSRMNDSVHLAMVRTAREKVFNLQTKMKSEIPFAFEQ